jgi:diguanylate cyclase (GGDEF)-like protein
MNKEALQTVDRFIEQLHVLSKPQLQIVSNFDKRLQVVSQNQVKIFYVVSLCREYREKEGQKTLTDMKLRAKQLLQEIMPQFKATLVTEDEHVHDINIQQEHKTISNEMNIFNEEIEILRKTSKRLHHISSASKAKIGEILQEFNDAAKKLSKEQDIVDRLKDIIDRLTQIIVLQKSMVINMNSALENISKGIITRKTKNSSIKVEDELWMASKQLMNSLRAEKQEVIKPLNKLLARKHEVHTYVSELLSRKHQVTNGDVLRNIFRPSTFFQKLTVRRHGTKITAADIDNDLHKLTYPSEVYLYVSLLSKHAELLDAGALKSLAPYLAIYAEKSRQVEEKMELTGDDPLFALNDIPVLNKQKLFQKIDSEIGRALRLKTPLTIIMFDIDNFSAINNTYGHLAGDLAIAEVGKICVTYARRRDDAIGRYGGEEITIVLPGSTSEEGFTVAERVRNHVEQHVFENPKGDFTFTISGGIAEFPLDLASTQGQFPDARTTEISKVRNELIEIADKHLRDAKDSGKNRILFKKSA